VDPNKLYTDKELRQVKDALLSAHEMPHEASLDVLISFDAHSSMCFLPRNADKLVVLSCKAIALDHGFKKLNPSRTPPSIAG
jgi:hypothetical protein